MSTNNHIDIPIVTIPAINILNFNALVGLNPSLLSYNTKTS